MSVLEEIEQLLAHYPPIVACESFAHVLKIGFCHVHESLDRHVIDKGFDSFQVQHCDLIYLLILHNHFNLVFEAHDHQIDKSLHRVLIKLAI